MDDLIARLEALEKDERHLTVEETRYWCDQYKTFARQLIREVAALKGTVRVPVEPTEEMVVAGIKALQKTKGSPVTRYGALYRAMLAAAPKEPK